MKRQRGRNRRSGNNNANRTMESNGPDVKVRGNAKQIFDKYETLARDAASGGNRVKAENYRQHAEHYLRIVNKLEAAKQVQREDREANQGEKHGSATDNDQSTDNVNDRPSEGGQDNLTEGKPKRVRRYPPQARGRRQDNGATSDVSEVSEANNDEALISDSSDVTPNGLELVTPDVEASLADDAEKPARRRKAPSRKKSDAAEETAAQVAE